tara:strand:- start:94431 stop:94721 length:291 start_codon:yes stop_codon:yes gene_type:complete
MKKSTLRWMAGVEGFEPSNFRRNYQVETFLCAHAQLTILTPKNKRNGIAEMTGLEPVLTLLLNKRSNRLSYIPDKPILCVGDDLLSPFEYHRRKGA